MRRVPVREGGSKRGKLGVNMTKVDYITLQSCQKHENEKQNQKAISVSWLKVALRATPAGSWLGTQSGAPAGLSCESSALWTHYGILAHSQDSVMEHCHQCYGHLEGGSPQSHWHCAAVSLHSQRPGAPISELRALSVRPPMLGDPTDSSLLVLDTVSMQTCHTENSMGHVP